MKIYQDLPGKAACHDDKGAGVMNSRLGRWRGWRVASRYIYCDKVRHLSRAVSEADDPEGIPARENIPSNLADSRLLYDTSETINSSTNHANKLCPKPKRQFP